MHRIACRGWWIVGIACLLLSAAVMAGSDRSRTLSFEERVEYQRRIEEVRWRYTIWPEANPTPKPALSEVLSDDAIRSKVEDALRKSSALAEYWQRPITAAQLQAEMERMARGTRHAELLLDLFAALDNDPFLIAECLARPALVDRLLRNWYAYDDRFHGDVGAAAESAMAGGVTASALPTVAEDYREVVFGLEREREGGERGAVRLDEDEWSKEIRRLARQFGVENVAPRVLDNPDDEVDTLFEEIPLGEVSALEETAEGWRAMTALSKAEGSIRLGIAQWPKLPFTTWWASVRGDLEPVANPSEGAYTAATVTSDGGCTPDTWRISWDTEEPTPRSQHTAVWTGARMIVWGGYAAGYLNTGGVYDPATDTWTRTSVEGAPSARYRHTAVWTGSRMIVWGGQAGGYLNTGGAYDPATDNWTPTSVEGAPSARTSQTAVWTGDRMIVWGGVSGGTPYNDTGGVYDPVTDSWTPTSVEDAPSGRIIHTAVWTDDRMIVWGGYGCSELPYCWVLSTGGVYDPATDSWTPTSTDGAPSERDGHTAVWTGDRMIVWGGRQSINDPSFNSGGVYDPATDSWTPTSTDGAPSERDGHTAVWTGDRMIVWGGGRHSDHGWEFEATGGLYDPGTDSWTPTSIEGAPSARIHHTAVWTGARMIVWGGGGSNTGGVYDPATDSWTPTAVGDALDPRSGHTAVWTGDRMIVWGGGTNTGGVYDPVTDSWTPTSVEGAPSARNRHTAVWTGSRMIVWGGYAAGYLNTGGLYHPATDSWTPTSVEGAPSGRSLHTAVWTGARMIVWGGHGGGYLNTGGVYDPATDSWTPTSVEGAPSGRPNHTAVWTGDRMIVWGGGLDDAFLFPFHTGGVYDPGMDSWMATSVEGAPSARYNHTAVWTGSRMTVWGGGGEWIGRQNTGGLYDPAADSWTATSVEGAPSARMDHTAVWTGARMIVWGGEGWSPEGTNTGGVYNPATDSWTPTSIEGAPSARSNHTAVYTGSEMLIWGGRPYSNELGAYCAPTALPPSFTSPECGGTIHVEPGETVEFTVTAEDAPERNVTLNADELPSDATMDPALPITGNPVSSHFTWTTDDSHNNTGHIVEFAATNEFGYHARCRVGIEVGDYTLVTLASFTAIPGDGQVTLHWTTTSEIDNAGFYLLRSTVATRGTVRLHKGLIPAMGDVFTGADYSYVDDTVTNGVEYEYTLVDVDLYGTETRHPPVRAIPNPSDPPEKSLSSVAPGGGVSNGSHAVLYAERFVRSIKNE